MRLRGHRPLFYFGIRSMPMARYAYTAIGSYRPEADVGVLQKRPLLNVG